MNSLAYIPASDGAANASLMTVTNVRSGGATTIQVNTVANVPAKFYASMGTPHTFTDPVTGETITVISEATAVDFAGHIDGNNVEIDEIAPGYTDNGNEVGDIIVIRPVTEWANNIFNVLSQSMNDDGSLKNGIVTSDKIDWGTLPLLIANKSTNTSIRNTTTTTIGSYNDVQAKDGIAFDESTGMITFLKTGFYEITHYVNWDGANAGYRHTYANVVGVPGSVSRSDGYANSGESFAMTHVFKGRIEAGATMAVSVRQSSGGNAILQAVQITVEMIRP